jgi:hypothetical protein
MLIDMIDTPPVGGVDHVAGCLSAPVRGKTDPLRSAIGDGAIFKRLGFLATKFQVVPD